MQNRQTKKIHSIKTVMVNKVSTIIYPQNNVFFAAVCKQQNTLKCYHISEANLKIVKKIKINQKYDRFYDR